MHAALALPIDRGRIAHQDLFSLLGYKPNGSDLFGDQHAAVGKEGQPPGQFEGGHRRHGERQAGCGLLFAYIDLGPNGQVKGPQQRKKQQCFRQFHRHFSLHIALCWRLYHFGIGIETALPAPRSAIQMVSPAGSTAVGVLSPSLMTVTLALSPWTVITEILPLPFSARSQFAIGRAHAVRPFDRLIHPDIDGLPALPAASMGMR